MSHIRVKIIMEVTMLDEGLLTTTERAQRAAKDAVCKLADLANPAPCIVITYPEGMPNG